jgi:hypothetical protein
MGNLRFDYYIVNKRRSGSGYGRNRVATEAFYEKSQGREFLESTGQKYLQLIDMYTISKYSDSIASLDYR